MLHYLPMLIDTHCHLDFKQFHSDRDEMIARARAAGVTEMIIPAVSLDNCAAVLALTKQYTGLYCAVGVHPNSTADWQPAHIDILRDYAQHPNVVAIGEIGVDYHWDKSPKTMQHQAFAAQMQLAHELDLPIIVHNREASVDCLRLMQASPLAGKDRPGVMHSFGADEETAVQAIALGFYLGFTGPITYKKATQTRAIAQNMPLDRILIETDAPYLSPVPYRGKRNEPAYVVRVAEQLANLHQIDVTEIGRITTRNARTLFKLIEGR